jgi:hypothetical protein
MSVAIATDDCLCVCDDREKFLQFKRCLEELFELTLQEGKSFRFLNLRIIQSPQGINIDQTDHIVDIIIGPYFKDRDTMQLMAITRPFPTNSKF